MDKKQFLKLRKLMINNILGTDNAKHFALLGDIEKVLDRLEIFHNN